MRFWPREGRRQSCSKTGRIENNMKRVFVNLVSWFRVKHGSRDKGCFQNRTCRKLDVFRRQDIIYIYI